MLGRKSCASLEREIRRIPPLLRKVFVLRDVDELPMPEVAEQLGISVAAAKSRLLRARLELRDRLEKHCGRQGHMTLTADDSGVAWRYRLTVRTEPSQGLNTSSILVSATRYLQNRKQNLRLDQFSGLRKGRMTVTLSDDEQNRLLDILSYWHKLEFFIPFDLDKPVAEAEQGRIRELSAKKS